MLDILITIVALPFLLIAMLFISIAIKCDDRGPVFFLSDRIGYHGKIFRMIKFRSMMVDAPDLRYADGSTYNSEDDQRVTRIGKILRKTSLDEIPQLLNILVGDMSLIGPRPDSAFYLSHYTNEERVILNVRPGITGYNQVVSRNSVGTKGKIQNDIYYVNHFSFGMDVQIFFLTIKNIIESKNVYREVTDKGMTNTAQGHHPSDRHSTNAEIKVGFAENIAINEAVRK